MRSNEEMAPVRSDGRELKEARVLFVGAPVAPYNKPGWTTADRFDAYGKNTGNLLIGQSLREALRLSHYELPSRAPVADADQKLDAIVVAAANFIFKGFDLGPYANIIERTNLRCVVAGLGAQAPHAGAKPTDIPEGSKRFLKVIAERSKVIGVRGNFTAEIMSEFGITNVRPIGCPSLFRSLNRDLRIRRPAPGMKLNVSLNGSRDTIVHMRSPEAALRVEAALIRLSMEEGRSYVLQSERPEIDIIAPGEVTAQHREQVRRICADLGIPATEEAFVDHVRSNGRLFFELGEWDDHVRSIDLSIGSRFHGNLVALTNGTPAIILNHDSRTTEMAELMGIPHVFTEDLQDIVPSRLLRRADFDGFEARYRVLYDRFADFLTENGLPHHLVDAQPVGEPDKVLSPVGRIAPAEQSRRPNWVHSVFGAFGRKGGGINERGNGSGI